MAGNQATKFLSARVSPSNGCDPELFLTKDGEVIGAERCIPQEGLPTAKGLEAFYRKQYANNGYSKPELEDIVKRSVAHVKSQKPSVVLDGVQVEIHPNPSTCRQGLAASIALCMKYLHDHLEENFGKDVQVSFEPVVEVSKKEYNTLMDSSKVLGCQTSLNIYDRHATINVVKDYRVRSAGGHMHLGNVQQCDPKRLVVLLDVLVGNTGVLLDPSNQKERRAHYGRAGEYRLPPHGLEYRTLSNFWMKHYGLMGLMFGLARMAVGVMTHTEFPDSTFDGAQYKWDAESDLLHRVDMDAIRTAINENDRALAMKNWLAIREFIVERVPIQTTGSYGFSLGPNFLDQFDKFLTKPVGHWLDTKDPLNHWVSKVNSVGEGWELFISGDKMRGAK